MKEARYDGLVMKALVVVVLMIAAVLSYGLYHLVAGVETNAYGVDTDSVSVSVQVDTPLCQSQPVIDDVEPIAGPASGGTEITIIGSDLNCVSTVIIGSNLRCEPITHIDDNNLKCVMPPHDEGYVDVTIVASGFDVATKSNGFRYVPGVPDSDGDGPLVPNTGLFRLGKQIVTLYDAIVFMVIIALCAIAIWLIARRPSRQQSKANKKA